MSKLDPKDLRSRQWFDNPENPEMTALYLERYLNYGLTRQELQSGKPIIVIAQTGSDLSPCNRHHIELAKRVRDGIIAAGGVPMEMPVRPIHRDRQAPNSQFGPQPCLPWTGRDVVRLPVDGVVLTISCDKTTPALLMAAATVNIPPLALSVGPILNGCRTANAQAIVPSPGKPAKNLPQARSTMMASWKLQPRPHNPLAIVTL